MNRSKVPTSSNYLGEMGPILISYAPHLRPTLASKVLMHNDANPAWVVALEMNLSPFFGFKFLGPVIFLTCKHEQCQAYPMERDFACELYRALEVGDSVIALFVLWIHIHRSVHRSSSLSSVALDTADLCSILAKSLGTSISLRRTRTTPSQHRKFMRRAFEFLTIRLC